MYVNNISLSDTFTTRVRRSRIFENAYSKVRLNYIFSYYEQTHMCKIVFCIVLIFCKPYIYCGITPVHSPLSFHLDKTKFVRPLISQCNYHQ